MRWCAVKAFVSKELKLNFRSKANLFWIFAWPAIWLLMTAFIFIPPSSGQPLTLNLGVINHDASLSPVNGTFFIKILNETTYRGTKLFDVIVYEDESALIDAIKHGRLDGGVVIPEKFGEDILIGQTNLTVYVGVKDEYSAQLVESILKAFINELNEEISRRKINETMEYVELYAPRNLTIPYAGNRSFLEFMRSWMLGIASPINATFKQVKPSVLMDRESTLGWFTFGALGMSMLYSGLSLGSTMIVEERDKGTLRRILASPASPTDMLVGKTISGIIILGIMSVVLVLMGVYVCGAKIIWNPLNPAHWLAILLLILLAVMMIGLGLLLSLFARDAKTAANLSVIIGLLLSFTAGIWFPAWWLPNWMRIIGELFPGSWALETIRSILIYEAKLAEALPSVLKVLTATAAIYALGIVIYRLVLRKYVES